MDHPRTTLTTYSVVEQQRGRFWDQVGTHFNSGPEAMAYRDQCRAWWPNAVFRAVTRSTSVAEFVLHDAKPGSKTADPV